LVLVETVRRCNTVSQHAEARMRKLVLALVATLFLTGCVSMIQSAYDERREQECEQERYGRERIDCR
jgi:outer membrane biogenesis lipoprotein LolB